MDRGSVPLCYEKMMEMKEEMWQAEVMRLQEQVKQQEKLASLGMLSAGIAHEIQNPLNFVINFSKMSDRLLKDLREIVVGQRGVMAVDAGEELEEVAGNLEENLCKIREHGERAISIIRGILLYSRGKEDEFAPTDVCRLVREYVWLAYHAMRANYKDFNIAVREDYDVSLGEVKLIPQDFSRVVLNLVNNACYAVRKKSEEEEDGYRPEIKVEVRKTAAGFYVTIEDNGTGMPEEVRSRLFTPFFTTKPVGEGTGLGLSIVRQIIEEKHKGRIRVETKEGKGTKIRLEIGS